MVTVAATTALLTPHARPVWKYDYYRLQYSIIDYYIDNVPINCCNLGRRFQLPQWGMLWCVYGQEKYDG